MNYDDMQALCHAADQERKREREEFKEENNPTITVPLKQWREMNDEIARLREALGFFLFAIVVLGLLALWLIFHYDEWP